MIPDETSRLHIQADRSRKLWVMVLVPIFVIVLIVLIIMIGYNINAQQNLVEKQVADQNKRLANTINNAIFDALRTGNNDLVRSQFARLNEKLPGVNIYVYDFRGTVSFSTDSSKIGLPMEEILKRTEAADTVNRMLTDHLIPESVSTVNFLEETYSVKHLPIFNESSCHHCHGQSKELLGGITVASSLHEVLDTMGSTRNRNILIGLAGLLVLVSSIYYLFFILVNKPVLLILKQAQYLRQGDFTHHIPTVKKDELAHILNRLNLIGTDMRRVFHSFTSDSDTLAESSSQLAGISEKLRSEAESTSVQSADVAESTREVSGTINSVAASMEETLTNINMVTVRSEELFKTISEIARSSSRTQTIIDEAAVNFKEVSDIVQELGNSVKEIDAVTDGIRDVSEQVNLLALNATIEAARAGEAGKGFAVVAQEIKDLAGQAAHATDDADTKLRRMQDMTVETIEKIGKIAVIMDEANSSINTIAVAVEEQSVSTQEISANITQAAGGIAEVNSNIGRTAEASEQVSKSVRTVDESTQEILTGSELLNQQASDLTRLAEKIKAAVHKFRI